MAPKNKGPKKTIILILHPQVEFHHISLVEKYYKIHQTLSDIEIFELYCWLEDKYLDKLDDIG